MSEVPSSAPPEVGQLPSPSGTVDLAGLVQTVAPLLDRWMEQSERESQREHDLVSREIASDASWRKNLLWFGAIIAAMIFGLAGMLLWAGKTEAALGFVQLAVAVAGAGFGGFGLARGRTARPDEDP